MEERSERDLTWGGASDQSDDRSQTLLLSDQFPVLVGPRTLANRSHDVGQDLDLALVELKIVKTLAVVFKESYQHRHQLQLLEALHVVLAHGELPEGARDGRHELLVAVVLRVLDERHQRLQASVGFDQGPGLLLLGTLEDGAGAVLPQLHVVVQEVADEVLHHPLRLYGHAVALLSRALLQCPDDGNEERNVLGLDEPGQEWEAPRLLDQQSVLLRLKEGF